MRRDYLLKFNEHWFLEVLRGGKLLFQAGHGLALVGICFGSLHIYPYPPFLCCIICVHKHRGQSWISEYLVHRLLPRWFGGHTIIGRFAARNDNIEHPCV